MSDYITDLTASLERNRKKIKDSRSIRVFKEGVPVIFDVIDGEISLIVNQMTAKEPLDRDIYLERHGRIRALTDLRRLLDVKADEGDTLVETVKSQEAQLKQVTDNGTKA